MERLLTEGERDGEDRSQNGWTAGVRRVREPFSCFGISLYFVILYSQKQNVKRNL